MVLHHGDGPGRCAIGQDVVKDVRLVVATYSLDPDIAIAVFLLEGIADRRSQ